MKTTMLQIRIDLPGVGSGVGVGVGSGAGVGLGLVAGGLLGFEVGGSRAGGVKVLGGGGAGLF